MALTDEQKAARAKKRQLAQALKEEARAHRLEAPRREWITKGVHLSLEEVANDETCRGSELPVFDNLGDWPATMHLSPVPSAKTAWAWWITFLR